MYKRQLSLLSIIPVLVGVSLARPISQRMDKRSAAIRLSLFAILWGPLMVVLRFAGLTPPNGSPWLLAMVVIHGALLVTAAIQIGILNSSMIMDAVDENELRTRERQEGVFVAVIAFTGKAVSGVGNFLGGVLLDVIDFPQGADADVGDVPEAVIFRLGLVAGPGLVIFHLIAVAFVTRLRLTRDRYREVALALETRRNGES